MRAVIRFCGEETRVTQIIGPSSSTRKSTDSLVSQHRLQKTSCGEETQTPSPSNGLTAKTGPRSSRSRLSGPMDGKILRFGIFQTSTSIRLDSSSGTQEEIASPLWVRSRCTDQIWKSKNRLSDKLLTSRRLYCFDKQFEKKCLNSLPNFHIHGDVYPATWRNDNIVHDETTLILKVVPSRDESLDRGWNFLRTVKDMTKVYSKSAEHKPWNCLRCGDTFKRRWHRVYHQQIHDDYDDRVKQKLDVDNKHYCRACPLPLDFKNYTQHQ